MYAMLGTRLDLAFAVSLVSRFTSNLDVYYYIAIKSIFRYLRALINTSITFNGTKDFYRYSNAEFSGDSSNSKLIGGYVFMFGSAPIS